MNRSPNLSPVAVWLAVFVIGCAEQTPPQGTLDANHAINDQPAIISPDDRVEKPPDELPEEPHLTNQEVANELATLLREAGVISDAVAITYIDGHAEIYGEMLSAKDKETALELVQQHPSVDTVKDRMTISP